jgi:hypothetical protein
MIEEDEDPQDRFTRLEPTITTAAESYNTIMHIDVDGEADADPDNSVHQQPIPSRQGSAKRAPKGVGRLNRRARNPVPSTDPKI